MLTLLKNRIGLGIAALLGAATAPGPTQAGILFAQNFETGLTPAESIVAVSPGFGRTNTATLGNGTFGIGHTQGYVDGSDLPTDYYQLTLNLTGRVGTTLAFDFNIATEDGFDEFGVLVNGNQIGPTSGFTPDNQFDFGTFSLVAVDGSASGRAVYDLGSFDGQAIVTIQIVLAPDFAITSSGTFIDNIEVTDNSVVPEPAAFALLGTGLLGLAATRRRKSA